MVDGYWRPFGDEVNQNLLMLEKLLRMSIWRAAQNACAGDHLYRPRNKVPTVLFRKLWCCV